MSPRPAWRPTDIDNEFGLIQWLGYPVRAMDGDTEIVGILADVKVDGMAAIVDHRDIVIAIVPAPSVHPHLSSGWTS